MVFSPRNLYNLGCEGIRAQSTRYRKRSTGISLKIDCLPRVFCIGPRSLTLIFYSTSLKHSPSNAIFSLIQRGDQPISFNIVKLQSLAEENIEGISRIPIFTESRIICYVYHPLMFSRMSNKNCRAVVQLWKLTKFSELDSNNSKHWTKIPTSED